MQSDSATEVPVDTQPVVEERLTLDAVKNKIKHMINDLLNVGMHGATVARHITMKTELKGSTENNGLGLTDHELVRLIMQCDEYFKIDTDVSVLGVITVADLVNKVTDALSAQDRFEAPVITETNNTSDVAGV